MWYDAVEFLNALYTPPGESAGPTVLVAVPDGPAIRPDDLPAEWRDLYEERAGIMEYDACMTRADAEAFALADILELMQKSAEDP